MRHFSESVILLDYDLNLHIRNNIIKLQSLVHNQLSSPRYRTLFKYFWFKSGYVAEKPGEFENPVEFSFKPFSNTLCKISGCQNVAEIRCLWCKKSLCFKHFFKEHHYYTTYSEYTSLMMIVVLINFILLLPSTYTFFRFLRHEFTPIW